jgi:serine/threonine-protein kinase
VGTVITFRVAKPPPPPAPVPVPDFYLKTKAQAIALAALAGLLIDVDHVLNPAKPEHRVYAQSIAAGTVVPIGTTISVRIAKHPPGPVTTNVPNLIGKTAAQATALLAAASLTGDKHEVSTNAHPPFKVYVQNPLAGANVPVGTTVHYTVAKPVLVVNVAVPNLIGMNKVQAHAAILAVDLAPDIDVAPAPGKPPGKVWQQLPAAGALVPKGTTVKANVASAALVAVPNLIGLTPAQANAALAVKGLGSDGQIQFQIFKPPGRVYSQNKVAGAMVAPATVVKWKANP